MMDYKNALAVASSFASFKNYRTLFLTGNPKYKSWLSTFTSPEKGLQNNDFFILPFKTPTKSDEIKYAMIALDAVIWDFTEKFPAYLHESYFSEAKRGSSISKPEFPDYFSFNSGFWSFLLYTKSTGVEEFIDLLIKGADLVSSFLNRKTLESPQNQLKIYDAITFLMQVILFYKSNKIVSDAINKFAPKSLLKVMNCYKKIFTSIELLTEITAYHEMVIRAILSPFR